MVFAEANSCMTLRPSSSCMALLASSSCIASFASNSTTVLPSSFSRRILLDAVGFLADSLRASANRLRSAARPPLPAIAGPAPSDEPTYDDDYLRKGDPG